MAERTVVITGASDGIGAAAARRLASEGARVIIVGRSPEKTKRVADELGVSYYLADFSVLDEVRALAADLLRDVEHIDVLANNAGGVMGTRQLTVDGYELTTQVNHLAPFLLTNLLFDVLIASKSIVIMTSSLAHRFAGKLDLGDLNFEVGYSAQRAYGRAKLMNILFTKELDRRSNRGDISAACFHPGIVRTGFYHEFGGSFSFVYTSMLRRVLRSPEDGADTLVWLATTRPDTDWKRGEYYKNRKISKASRQASNATLANELWEVSAKLTGIN